MPDRDLSLIVCICCDGELFIEVICDTPILKRLAWFGSISSFSSSSPISIKLSSYTRAGTVLCWPVLELLLLYGDLCTIIELECGMTMGFWYYILNGGVGSVDILFLFYLELAPWLFEFDGDCKFENAVEFIVVFILFVLPRDLALIIPKSMDWTTYRFLLSFRLIEGNIEVLLRFRLLFDIVPCC